MTLNYQELMRMFDDIHGYDVHNERFVQSILYLADNVQQLKDNVPLTVFEVGWRSNFTTIFQRVFPNAHVVHTSTDIRVPFTLDVPKVDLVICMEVFEHLCDLPSSDIGTTATFTASGMDGFLKAMQQYLHKDSVVFITTPNVTNYACIANLLFGSDPFAYQPHHREVSPAYLRRRLEETGYKVVKLETKNVWNNHRMPYELLMMIRGFIDRLGQDQSLRDDDIFVLATVV